MRAFPGRATTDSSSHVPLRLVDASDVLKSEDDSGSDDVSERSEGQHICTGESCVVVHLRSASTSSIARVRFTAFARFDGCVSFAPAGSLETNPASLSVSVSAPFPSTGPDLRLVAGASPKRPATMNAVTEATMITFSDDPMNPATALQRTAREARGALLRAVRGRRAT